MALGDKRRLLAACGIPRARVTRTHDLRQARAAEAEGADLIAFGPVFPTVGKRNPGPVVGLGALTRACAEVSRPVVAIGGVDLDSAARVRGAGARFGAAIGALSRADNPERAARHLHEALGGTR